MSYIYQEVATNLIHFISVYINIMILIVMMNHITIVSKQKKICIYGITITNYKKTVI